jgi:MFS family permease
LATTQTASQGISDTFASFRYRNYRLWFIGQLVSLVGTWMQNTAQGFLIYTLTSSAAFLGYVGFTSGIPSWLFMMYGGVIADRVPRRALMMITQTVMMMLAFVLAGLVFFDVVQPWHILVLAFLLGTANAFETPARQSFVVELVDREDMTNAIAFNATMFNLGAVVGPAIGGLIYALTGPAWCFIINGISFIAVIIALALMQIKPLEVPIHRPSAYTAIAESVSYIRSQSMVITLMLSVFIYNVFGFGLVTLIPAWAVKILHGDVTTNGLLLAARGVGAVIGGLMIASFGRRNVRGKMWAVGSFLIPLMIAGFALTGSIPLSLVLLAGMGLSLIIIMNNSNAMVQSSVPDHLRGRVMGLYSMMFMGGGPVGSLLIGVAAQKTSEQATALVCAGILLIFAGVIWVVRPQVRKMG